MKQEISRRDFLKALGCLMLSPAFAQFQGLSALAEGRILQTGAPNKSEVWVNDIHSQFNRTRVLDITQIASQEDALNVVRCASHKHPIAIAGGCHAGGGQQFLSNELLVDINPLNRVLHFDREKGLVTVESGIQWPTLIDRLWNAQQKAPEVTNWSIRQKQTGADKLTVGGAVSSNVHSRGLGMQPFISDVESLQLITPAGELITCSRTENDHLFELVNGGYGLFGLIYSVTLRLVQRTKVQRVVTPMTVDGLVAGIEAAQARGAKYGDYQFSIDNSAEDFLTGGVMATYEPVPIDTPIPENQKFLTLPDWIELVELGHTDKRKAFAKYIDHYLETNGQIYWSDTHQLGPYRENYHQYFDKKVGAKHPGSEGITELYVPREKLPAFMHDVQGDFRKNNVDVLYGTVRFIEQDTESFLAWAKQRYACVIFNLHTEHSPSGLRKSAEAFRRLIDYALKYGGSYYLTYHRFARKDQLLAVYPQFPTFLALKRRYDPQECFQSDWYRHYKKMFRRELSKPLPLD